MPHPVASAARVLAYGVGVLVMFGVMIASHYMPGLGGGVAFLLGVICLGVLLLAAEIVAVSVETIWGEKRR